MHTSSSNRSQESLATAAGKTVQISLTFFLNHVLPPLQPGIDVDEVLRTLRKIDPTEGGRTEEKPLAFIENTVQAIPKAADSRKTSVALQKNALFLLPNAKRNSRSLPDMYFSHSLGQRWVDIVALGEYKETGADEDIQDNVAKVTNSMSECMFHDRRRRFLFSFTVENTNMRLWFCDRARTLVSEPFHFIKDQKAMIHFFLSIMYADPQEIGLDPTIAPSAGGDGYYDITVRSDDGQPRTYRALKLLFDAGERLHGKGVRVWLAVRIENGNECGEPVILKDVWSYAKRKSEGTIIEHMRDNLPPQNRNPPFVSVECHGDVLLVDGDNLLVDYTPSWDPKGWATKTQRSRAQLLAEPAASELVEREQKLRIHYRIVLKEVCRPLTDETSLVTIFGALAQTSRALQVMHEAGWVHRDLSPGNILLREDGTVLLADFEFAKQISEDDDEKRIGTLPFMAVEVETQEYHFGGYRKFQYNVLHDLESLWWVAVYYVVDMDIVLAAPNTDEQHTPASDAHRTWSRLLFYDDFQTRLGAIQGQFSYSLRHLPPTAQRIAKQLDQLRDLLLNLHYAVQWKVCGLKSPEVIADVQSLHERFSHVFQTIADDEETQHLVIRDFSPAPPAAPSLKRVRSEPEAGEVDVEPISPSTKKVKINEDCTE